MQPTRFLPARALKDRLTGWPAVTMLPALLLPAVLLPAVLLPAVLLAGEPAHAELVARASWSDVEQEILTEHNRLRQNPQSYVPILEAYLARMDAQGNIPNGCGSNCTLLTQEGQAAVEEAIRFLQNQAPTGALAYSAEAAQAAQAHAQDQRDGAIGHRGSDGSSPSQRLSQFGVESHASGENIAYGPQTAQTVLMNLLIDDGVADRGHRTNLFSPEWTMAGVGCGPHATIRTVCVIDYVKAPQTTASNSQLSIVNNGTVELLSLKVASLDILGGPLAPGESRKILLNNEQACDVTLNIYMGGNYQPLDWEGLNICNAQMTMDSKNSFTLSY
ncbi:MAG: CAP domain-containing protein [Cyanobacteria bacterium P01_A01_bin.116]